MYNNIFSRNLGFKSYELKDHLGNVRTTVSDVKIPTGTRGIAPYIADLKSLNEYYPFGMLIDGQSVSSGNYRYGYNGKENDNEAKGGAGKQIDYGARIYDSRVARFLSVDPLKGDYEFQSPYLYAYNNPISFIDENGEWGLLGQSNLTKISKYIKYLDDKTLERIDQRSKEWQIDNPGKKEPPLHKAQVAVASYSKTFGAVIGLDTYREAVKGKDLDGNEVTGFARAGAILFFAIERVPGGAAAKRGLKLLAKETNIFSKALGGKGGEWLTKGIHFNFSHLGKGESIELGLKVVDGKLVGHSVFSNNSDKLNAMTKQLGDIMSSNEGLNKVLTSSKKQLEAMKGELGKLDAAGREKFQKSVNEMEAVVNYLEKQVTTGNK